MSTSPSLPTEETRWFTEQVQPHEQALRAYLRARFSSQTDQDDLVQEAYARLFQAKAAGKIHCAKAFLFTTARNIAFDFLRRRQVISMEALTDFNASSVLEESPTTVEMVNQSQELQILTDAIETLPDRCRQVITLRYLERLSYKDIALRLEISPETVKVHMTKGMRRCSQYFQDRGLLPAPVEEGQAGR